MINRLAFRIGILVDDGEGGRCDNILNTHCLADGFDERRLACSHSAIEGENAIFAHFIDEFTRSRRNVFEVLYLYSHLFFVVLNLLK